MHLIQESWGSRTVVSMVYNVPYENKNSILQLFFLKHDVLLIPLPNDFTRSNFTNELHSQ